MGYITPAWRRCIDRFDEVKLFIDESAPTGKANTSLYRADLYSSWVLLAYAACQFAVDEIGRGCMQFLGWRYRYPSSLPNELLMSHQKLTLDTVRWLAERSRANPSIKQLVQQMHSSEWASHSSLLKLERNVWPDAIREWLRRLGVTGDDLQWMKEPVSGKTETYESRMASLVQERNPIAHGQSPSNILSMLLMKEWVGDCALFMEKCAMTVALRLAMDHSPRLSSLGISVNKELGNHTIAIRELKHPVNVQDHVLLASGGKPRKIVRIDSIMSGGISYDRLPAGRKHVALGLNGAHHKCNAYLTP